MKRRAFYLILITTVTMVITYVPYCIAGFFTIVTKKLIDAHWVPGLVFLRAGWFCSACSLSAPGWKTLLSLIRPVIVIYYE